MRTIISNTEETIQKAAEHVKKTVEEKPDAVLALAVGRGMTALYTRLAEMCAGGEMSLRKVKIFAAAELCGAAEGKSLRAQLSQELVEKTDLKAENVFFPALDKPEEYDGQIAAAGGIRLAVLDIGQNGRIGFNEPATPFASLTHEQRLTDSTKRELGEEAEGVARAVTMGIKTIVSAEDILLLALGEEKAESIFKAVYGRTDSWIPAAFLQVPTQVTFYLDTGAAEKL